LKQTKYYVFVFSIFTFLYFTGGTPINFVNNEWLSPGDSAWHWINWLFFKETSILQFPIFENYDYGMELSSSIAINDSLPIMALIFKPFSSILPFDFQYFGLWILICFIMQGQLGLILLRKITKNEFLSFIGACFFILAPPFLWRLWGHYSLMAHWLIILGIIIFYSNNFNLKNWIFLLILTALVNAYILAIILSIFILDLIFRRSIGEFTKKESLLIFFKTFSLLLLSLYVFGYFSNGVSIGSGGYSLYRANLNTFFNDNNFWSYIMPDIGSIPNDYEGFGFLGIGMIILLVISLYEIFRNQSLINSIFTKKNTYLLCLSLILFLFAITNKVTFGSNVLFEFDLPEVFKLVTRPLRSSGRMVWLIFYLIYCAIFFILARSKHIRVYKYLLPILLIVQILDTGAVASNFRFKMSDSRAYYLKPYINSNDPANIAIVKTLNSFWDSPLTSPEWVNIKDNYDKIIYIYPKNRPKNAYPLVYFAAKNKMATNFGYFSRYKGSKRDEIYSKIDETLNTSSYDINSIYVFDELIDDKWKLTLQKCLPTDLCKVLDGYRVFAKDFNLK
tara:strand:+ start:25359 stop:27044 length:1686 start_codon:yes stop_codon:yes gene_type:complete